MRAVGAQELENDLSAALREAHDYPVVVLNRQRPEAVLLDLDADPSRDELGIRLSLAAALYRDKTVSLGRAARFCGLSLAEFIQHVPQLAIPVGRGAAASAREYLNAILEWQENSSSPMQAP